MSESFLSPNFMFEFEGSGDMVGLHHPAANGAILPAQHSYLKTEHHSPVFPTHPSLQQQHQHQQQQQHQSQQQPHNQHHQHAAAADDDGKLYDSYYTDLSSRELSMTELELQNNNSGYVWPHPGLMCQQAELGGMVDHLDGGSLSDQSTLNLSFEADEKFGVRGHQLVGGVNHGQPKKGRGGRKKSQRYEFLSNKF